MHRTGKILFLCLFFVGADFQAIQTTVSDKNRHGSISKFIGFWQELELFVWDLKAALQHYCPDRSVTQKCLTDHFNSLAELGTRAKKTDEMDDLLAVMDQTIYDLGQIETFLRNLALFFKIEAAKGFSDDQMQLSLADAQAQIYLEPICKKLDLLLKKAAAIREILFVSKAQINGNGQGWVSNTEIGFCSKQARINFEKNELGSLLESDLKAFKDSGFPTSNKLLNYSHEDLDRLGIVHRQNVTFSVDRANFGQKRDPNYFENEMSRNFFAIKSVGKNQEKDCSVSPKKTLRFTSETADQISNLTFQCQPFSSTESDSLEGTKISFANRETNSFGELDGIFSRPNAEERFLPHNGVIKPKTLDQARQDLIDGSQVCFRSIKSGDSPDSEGGLPSNSSENSSDPNRSGNDSGNSKKSQEVGQESQKKKKKEAFYDENFFAKTKSEMTDNLHKQGLFSSLSPESNKNLCKFGGHLYALGAQDMAQHLENYIEEKDAFFNRLQLDNLCLQTIFQNMSKPIAPEDKAEIARHYDAIGQVLPGNLNANSRQVNAICQMRIVRAVEDFQRGMPLPKDFLRQLTQVQWQKLIDHSISTLGLAIQNNSYLMSMHEFTHAATRAGYKMGYKDCMKDKEPLAPELQSMLDQEREKNEILGEKLEKFEAENKKKTEMLSKTTAYLEKVRQAQNERSKEFAEKNNQIDELKNKVQSLENDKTNLEREKESIAQTSKKQIAALFSSFKNKLDEAKSQTSEAQTTEPKPETSSSTPSPKQITQNISNSGVVDDEKEQLRLENENLKKQLQELEQSQSARPKMYFKDAGKFKKVSDDSSKNTEFENILSEVFKKGYEKRIDDEKLLNLRAEKKQLMAEISMKDDGLDLNNQLIDNLKKEIEMLTKKLEEERSQTNILLEVMDDEKK